MTGLWLWIQQIAAASSPSSLTGSACPITGAVFDDDLHPVNIQDTM